MSFSNQFGTVRSFEVVQHLGLRLLLLVLASIDEIKQSVNRKVLTLREDREIRSAPLGLRVLPSLKEALEKAAKNDRRSVAAMAELILTDWLTENGYLEKD